MIARASVIMERICTSLGALGLLVVGVVYLDSFIGADNAVDEFNQIAGAASAASDTPDDGAPVGLLTIHRLEVEVPVFADTDKLTLNRGAGIVNGTALPGESGNVAISAHRDSFFRPLKDLRIGDVIELYSHGGAQQFKVSEIFITDPLDTSVLDPTPDSMLTLITCYPFYYVGFAPDRYIVRAAPVNPTLSTLSNQSGVIWPEAIGFIGQQYNGHSTR